MKTIFWLILWLLALSPIIHAQDATPAAPWPPDPAEIFAEGVEVVSTEIVEPPMDARPVADDQARVLRVYNETTKQWREYPYPNDLAGIIYVEVRSDGTLLINPPYSSDESSAWLFDPKTGEFSRAEIVCGWRVKALPSEGQWVFAHTSLSESRLCFTETGEIGQRLPGGIAWSGSGRSPNLSSDGKWLALMGFGGDYPNAYAEIYSYEISTEMLNYLGRIQPLLEDVYFENWIGDTHIAIFNGDMPEIWQKDVYDADVTQPNSLRYALPGLSQYYDDPPRDEYITTTAYLEWEYGVEWPEHEPCQLTLYDVRGVYHRELGYDCANNQVLHLKGSKYLFIRIDESLENTSILSLIDAHTGEYTELANGPFVYLDSVSPDGRYALLMLDGERQILKDYFSDIPTWGSYPNGYLAIFDIQKSQFVYESRSLASPNSFVWSQWEAVWCGNDCLLMWIGRAEPISLIVLDGWGVTETRVNAVGYSNLRAPKVSPTRQQMIARTSDNGIGVLDFSTKTYTPLVSMNAQEQYDVEYNWIDAGHINITVWPEDQRWRNGSPYVRYTIGVP